MDITGSMETILISLACSVVAGIFVAYLLKFREGQIRKQIEDLDSQEQFLEKLAKGNVKLLRSSLFLIFLCLFSLIVSSILAIGVIAVSPPESIKLAMFGLAACLLTMSGTLCVYQAKSIVQSSDLKGTRRRFQAKREKLQGKIT